MVLMCGIASGGEAAAQVKTATGLVKGTTSSDGRIRIFKGIPFAAAPVGELRWQAPRPAAPWEGTRDATRVRTGVPPGQHLRRHRVHRHQ